MNVNATLLVQIVNFYIACLLFRHILLRPGYQALLEKESHQSSLEDMVSQEKLLVEKGRQKQKDAWAAFRDWSKKHLPLPSDRSIVFREVSVSLPSDERTPAQIKKARTQLANTMISSLKERYEC